jgi:hypothetical protein
LETGQPEGCPARTTIIDRGTNKHHSRKMGVPEQRQKDAWRVWCRLKLLERRPAADFATAGKLYLETAKRSKPEKGAVC